MIDVEVIQIVKFGYNKLPIEQNFPPFITQCLSQIEAYPHFYIFTITMLWIGKMHNNMYAVS